MQESNEGDQKVFAYFGGDLQGEDPNCLAGNVADGYTLLALDAPAISAAAGAGLPFTLIDDWIDTDARRHARERADECLRGWYESARDAFTVDGICWPEFDRHALFYFWQEVFVALALADSFRKRRIAALKFFQYDPKRPCIQNSEADISRSIWQKRLPDLAEVILKPKPATLSTPKKRSLWQRAVRYGKRRVGTMLRLAWPVREPEVAPVVASDPVEGIKERIVLACYDFEFFRFELVIGQVVEAFSGRFAGVIANPDNFVAPGIADKWNFPVMHGPFIHTGPEPDLQELFTAAFRQAESESTGSPWHEPLQLLGFDFEYCCTRRWPFLVMNYRKWCQLWKQALPLAVIVSTNLDSESQLPAAAARTLGISTYAIPHGAADVIPDNLISGETIFCEDLLQKKVWCAIGIAGERLQLCRGVVPASEYLVRPVSVAVGNDRCHILALTESLSWSSRIMGGSHKAQLQALSILAEPPGEIRDDIHVSVKLHPHHSESELLTAVRGDLRENVLPLDSDLITLLSDTDLVVSVNYLGSALVHVLRATKPVIFLWTDPLIGYLIGQEYGDLFRNAGVVARTGEEFWKLVDDFINNVDCASSLRARACSFCGMFLDNSDQRTIDNAIACDLGDRVEYRWSERMSDSISDRKHAGQSPTS
jgi:hypothetical protein